MAEIIRRNSTKITGAILLDKQCLEELNGIIDEEWKRLSDVKKRQLDNEVRREREEYRRSKVYELQNEDAHKEREAEIKKRIESSYRYSRDLQEWKVLLETG